MFAPCKENRHIYLRSVCAICDKKGSPVSVGKHGVKYV